MKDRMRRACLGSLAPVCFGLLATTTGCGDDPAAPEPPGTAGEIQAQAAALIALVPVLGVDAPNLVSAVPCVFRGYILMRLEDPAGARDVEFVGCELIPGVRLDGTGRVRLPVQFIERSQDLVGVVFAGSVNATTPQASQSIRSVEITSIFASVPGRRPSLSEVRSLGVSVDGANVTLTDSALFTRVTDISDRTLTSLRSSTLSELEARDLERIAVDFGGIMAGVFLNELLETQRGDHRHVLDCGILDVQPIQAVNTTLTWNWTRCPQNGGLVMDGTYVQTGIPPFTQGAFAWTLSGDFRLGGAVPRVELDGMDWTVTFPNQGGDLDRDVRLDVVLRQGSTIRSVTLDVYWGT